MFKLNGSGTFANKVGTTEWHNVDSSEEYLAWLAAGNAPEQADSGAGGIAVCSSWQIRKALNALGLRQQVEDTVAASDDIELKDGWSHAGEFRSDNPFVLQMGASLDKDADETRAMIEYASTL